MTKHVHAELMMEYAKDALETETPWERWEYAGPNDSFFTPCIDMPMYRENWKYRRKPKTVRIGEFEIAEPENIFVRQSEIGVVAIRFRSHEDAMSAFSALKKCFYPRDYDNENN